jgi:hypothetical protein
MHKVETYSRVSYVVGGLETWAIAVVVICCLGGGAMIISGLSSPGGEVMVGLGVGTVVSGFLQKACLHWAAEILKCVRDIAWRLSTSNDSN